MMPFQRVCKIDRYGAWGSIAALWTEDTWFQTSSMLATAYGLKATGVTKLGPSVVWRGGEIIFTSSSGRPGAPPLQGWVIWLV